MRAVGIKTRGDGGTFEGCGNKKKGGQRGCGRGDRGHSRAVGIKRRGDDSHGKGDGG